MKKIRVWKRRRDGVRQRYWTGRKKKPLKRYGMALGPVEYAGLLRNEGVTQQKEWAFFPVKTFPEGKHMVAKIPKNTSERELAELQVVSSPESQFQRLPYDDRLDLLAIKHTPKSRTRIEGFNNTFLDADVLNKKIRKIELNSWEDTPIKKEGEIIGSYKLEEIKDNKGKSFFNIQRLEINPEHRGKGYGKEVINELLHEHGKDNITAVSKKDSVGFWKKVGGKIGPKMPTREEEYFVEF